MPAAVTPDGPTPAGALPGILRCPRLGPRPAGRPPVDRSTSAFGSPGRTRHNPICRCQPHLTDLLLGREAIEIAERSLRRVLAEAGVPSVRRRRPRSLRDVGSGGQWRDSQGGRDGTQRGFQVEPERWA